jgi:hypothetical protein
LPVSDDWRLRVVFQEAGHIEKLTDRVEASELKHDLEASFHDRLAVSGDGEELFCYAGTREQAEQAGELVRSLATEHGWHVDLELRRWHDSAERWEDPDIPLPETDAARAAEHAELLEEERQELETRGYPEFEVRVEFDSHRAATAFADRLREEGFTCVRRWKYLIVAATDEDSANDLAARLRDEAGPTSTVVAEGSGKAAYDERPTSRFWFLGGLAG